MTQLKVWQWNDPTLPTDLQLIKNFFLKPLPAPEEIKKDYRKSYLHLYLTGKGIDCFCPPCLKQRLAGKSNSSERAEGVS